MHGWRGNIDENDIGAPKMQIVELSLLIFFASILVSVRCIFLYSFHFLNYRNNDSFRYFILLKAIAITFTFHCRHWKRDIFIKKAKER